VKMIESYPKFKKTPLKVTEKNEHPAGAVDDPEIPKIKAGIREITDAIRPQFEAVIRPPSGDVRKHCKPLINPYTVRPVKEAGELSDTELIGEILKLKPTIAKWAVMRKPEKMEFKVCGIGLNALARRFGVQGNPIGSRPCQMELGKKIYGENSASEMQKSRERLLADEIKKQIPTEEEWASMKHQQKLNFKVDGMGLFCMARKFGVAGNPITNHPSHLELGGKIYGNE
jgi:hypothetical protein